MEKESFRLNTEQRENQAVCAKTLTADQLKDLIYKGENIPQDNRFIDESRGGVFKYFYLDRLIKRDLNPRELFYPAVLVDDKIVGLCELEKSTEKDQKNTYWIIFMSVDPAYQDKGYGSKLAEEAFRFAKEKGAILEGSRYSDSGLAKLQKVLRRLADKYGVTFIEREENS